MPKPLINRLVVALLDLVEAIEDQRVIVDEKGDDFRQSRQFQDARALLAEIAEADTDSKPRMH